jgi:hypothetical protein
VIADVSGPKGQGCERELAGVSWDKLLRALHGRVSWTRRREGRTLDWSMCALRGAVILVV